jgi:hypothetical protein
MSENVPTNYVVTHNGCSSSSAMDMTPDEDGPLPPVSGVVNGHVCETSGADAPTGIITQTDRDVVRLIAQHLQNLGLK